MPRGFLVKRQPEQPDPGYHSDHSDDAPTDLSKKSISHQVLHPTAVIHPYPPPGLFAPHLHPMVVERLQHHFYPPSELYPEYYHLYQPLRPAQPVCQPAGLLLDLTIKASTPITPPATPSPVSAAQTTSNPNSGAKRKLDTPGKATVATSPSKKHKAATRRLHFDEDKSSPVSGTIIKELNADDPPLVVRKGDIDPAFNVVEVTEEAKADLAKIENRIGDYICKLCCEMYDDAFMLAQHRCSRIVHVEYRCPECDKVFNCPANLASHRRWHKPRQPPAAGEPVDLASKKVASAGSDSSSETEDSAEQQFPCDVCHKRFRRQAYLRKHQATHGPAAVAPGQTTLCAPVPHLSAFQPLMKQETMVLAD
ncbi:insulinoma-associated protein 1b-like [Neocloeon triangulifer]|uniref:insulinoma-associated protein 1b-like n=1 Tax=Neocloeon triangulifer TaxID=2078957 RepID=UPI00286EE61B|nr:insulinoma-associated protein 1b-like [Neocloeon triangulifer]